MPFKSKAQMKKCFAMKGRNQARGWDCHEWADHTRSVKKLPEKKGEAVIRAREKQAATVAELMGVYAAARLLGMR